MAHIFQRALLKSLLINEGVYINFVGRLYRGKFALQNQLG